MHWKWMLLLIVANSAYLLLGGLIFSVLEQDNNLEIRNDTRIAYGQFLDNYSCVSEAALYRLTSTVIAAHDAGVLVLPNDTSTESEWTFQRAVFFCVTVVTTIGYGTIAPSTAGGRIFFIFYAMVGIPMLLTFLAQTGVRIGKLNKILADKIRFSKNPKLDAYFDTLLLFILGYLVFIIVPAGIFTATEGWTFSESAYFAIVTLSTVGFGDYVPGTTEDGAVLDVYSLFLSVWMFMGLAWFAGVISTIQNTFEIKVDTAQEDRPEEDSPEEKSRQSSRDGSISKDSEKVEQSLEPQDSEVCSVRF